MGKGARGRLTYIGGFVVLLVVIGIVIAVTSNGKSSPTRNTTTGGATGPSAKSANSSAQATKPQTFSGNGSKDIGKLNVPVQSTLHWSCPSCANDNFAITNSTTDANLIRVDALGPTSGHAILDAGTYHSVEIDTEGGAWTITIDPGP